MNEGKIKVRVVDTPGTYKDNEAEATQLIEMVDCLQKKVKKVHRFLFTISIEEFRLDETIRGTLQKFEDSLGTEFWDHLDIVYTMWAFDDEAERDRRR